MSSAPTSAKSSTSGAVRGWIGLIALTWGLNWPAVKLALNEMPVWSMRAASLTAGAALLLLLARASGRTLAMARDDWAGLVIAGLLNITGFNVLTAIAQTLMPTSRAVILAYTMPLWTALLARLFRRAFEPAAPPGTRARRRGAGGGCRAAVVEPRRTRRAGRDSRILGAAVSWAAGTIVTKRAAFSGDPVVTTGWRLAVGAVTVWAGVLAFEGAYLSSGAFGPTTAWGWSGLVYTSVIGIALSYFLWFGIVARLPASAAAIGVLLVPVIGVTSAMAIIGEQPSLFDGVGFLLIIAAVVVNMRA